MPHVEQTADGLASVGTVVEAPFVDVHADELVGRRGIEVTGELHRVGQRFFAVLQTVLNALPQSLRYGGHQLWTKRAPDTVASKRKRQACHFLPPLAEIDDAMQAGFVVGELALVNDETGLVLPFQHLRNDLIEANNFGVDAGSEQLKSKIRRGQFAGDSDLLGLDLAGGERAWRNDHWPITFAAASAARHQSVFVLNIRIGVEGDRSDVVNPIASLLIQRLDIAKGVGKAQSRWTDLVRC